MAIAPAIPHNEPARLKALERYSILDTPADGDMDDLAKVAAQICGTPVSLVSLIDSDRQWFKSRYGPVDVTETSRDISFCGHAILQDDVFEVTDAKKDKRFADNPMVIGMEGIPLVRFYAGAPLMDASGHPLGSLCVVDSQPRELTPDQKDALRALSRQVVKLFELRRAGTELASALDAKSEFMQIASHDLKNPLTVVTAASSMLAEMHGPEETPAKRLAESIMRQARTMKALVEDYLDAQAIEAGQLRLELAEADARDLIVEVVADLQNYSASKGTTIVVDADMALPPVLCDAARVKQIATNLIGNAIKFSPRESTVVIMVRAAQELPNTLQQNGSRRSWVKHPDGTDAAEAVVIEVRDAGPGISDQDIPALFTAHAKLSARPTGGEKSSGLGLRISKQLVELQGGRIGVNNTEGGGATFWFALPVAE